MEVIREAGNRKSWEEMDIESRQAVYVAEWLVENKRGVATACGERTSQCKLHVVYGCNISNTQINIIDRNGLVVAFYSEGCFYDGISKQQVELF